MANRDGAIRRYLLALCALVLACCHVPAREPPAPVQPAAPDTGDEVEAAAPDPGPGPSAPAVARPPRNPRLPGLGQLERGPGGPFELPADHAERRIFGVLHPEQPLYVAPDAAGDRLPFLHDQGRWPREVEELDGGVPRWETAGVLVEIRGRRGDWIEVRTRPLAVEGVPCHPGLGGYGPYELRGFVEARALLPVIQSPTEVAFEDGTSVGLVPGVVVHPRENGEYYIGLPGLGLTVALPPRAVGLWFEPIRATNEQPAAGFQDSPAHRQFLLGDRVQVDVIGSTVAAIDEQELSTLATECASLRMRPVQRPREPQPVGRVAYQVIGHGGGGGHCMGVGSYRPTESDWRVPAGTAVYWSDGREAGVVRVAHTYLCVEPVAVKQLRCFGGSRDPAATDRTASVCFAAGDLAELPRGERREPEPKVELGAMMIKGDVEREAVRRVVRERSGEVEACYRAALERRPDVSGRLSVKVVVLPDGTIKAAAIAASTVSDEALGACVLSAVRSWPLPAPAGDQVAILLIPFQLSAD